VIVVIRFLYLFVPCLRDMGSGGLAQCSVRGPRALKNLVGYGCVLDALLFTRANEDRELRHIAFVTPRGLHPLMLDKLLVRLGAGPLGPPCIACESSENPLLLYHSLNKGRMNTAAWSDLIFSVVSE
jgi:hypothetical protein